MPSALISLGSNLGDRQHLLEQAIRQLQTSTGISNVTPSSWHETPAVGGPPNQGPYLNGAALIETNLTPQVLHSRLKEIESDLGRDRITRWAPRTIDLDLLLFGDQLLDSRDLTIPHLCMAFRRFVIEPAAEIAPEMIHPQIGWTINQLRDHLRAASPYVAITGSSIDEVSLAGRKNLAAAAARATGWRTVQCGAQFPAQLGANSPSPTLPVAIEFLRTACNLLARDFFPTDPAKAGVITPFWMEEILALGDVLWPGELACLWGELAPKRRASQVARHLRFKSNRRFHQQVRTNEAQCPSSRRSAPCTICSFAALPRHPQRSRPRIEIESR